MIFFLLGTKVQKTVCPKMSTELPIKKKKMKTGQDILQAQQLKHMLAGAAMQQAEVTWEAQV